MYRRMRRKRGATNLAEFAPALFVLFFVGLPLVDLIGFGTGVATCWFAAFNVASQTSKAPNFNAGMSEMVATTNSIIGSAFGKFAKVQPVGGYSNSGMNVYIEQTNPSGGATTVVGPNSQLSPPVDTNKFIYQLDVIGTYDIHPWLPLGSMPYINQVPILGKPARIQVTADRNLEMAVGWIGPSNYGFAGAMKTDKDGNSSLVNSGGSSSGPGGTSVTVGGNGKDPPVTMVTYVRGTVNGQSGVFKFTITSTPGGTYGNQVSFSGQFLVPTNGNVDLSQNFSANGGRGGADNWTVNPGGAITGQYENISSLDQAASVFEGGGYDKSGLSGGQVSVSETALSNFASWASSHGY